MDEYQRTERHVTTEEVTPADPVDPYYARPPVAPRSAVRDRIVTDSAYVSTGPTPIEMARRVVGLAFGILQALLVLRIILLLLIANRDNNVVQFILSITGPFVEPFRGMFALDQIGNTTGSVLDLGALVALIGWSLIEALLIAILSIGSRRTVTY